MGSAQSEFIKRDIEEFNDETNKYINDYLEDHKNKTGISNETVWENVYSSLYEKHKISFERIENSFSLEQQQIIYKCLKCKMNEPCTRDRLTVWEENKIFDFLEESCEMGMCDFTGLYIVDLSGSYVANTKEICVPFQNGDGTVGFYKRYEEI